MTMRRVSSAMSKTVAGCAALVVLTAACGASGHKAVPTAGSPTSTAPVSVRVGYYQGSFFTWLVDLASAAGFFRKSGIDAHMVPISAGGPVAFAGLVEGSLDLVMGDTTLAGPRMDKGIALRVITGATSAGWVLVAGKGENLDGPYPKAMQSLKGKGIGVVGLGTSSYFYAQQLVTDAGLAAGAVTYQALGGLPAAVVSAIDSGRVAAAMTDPVTGYLLVNLEHNQAIINTSAAQVPIFGAETDPETLLPASSPLRSLKTYPDGWEFVTTNFAKAHPDTVRRIRLALEETDVWMHNPAELAAVQAGLEKADNIPQPIVQANVTTPFLQAVLPLIGASVSAAGIAAFQQFWVDEGLLTKTIPVGQWYVPGIPESPAAVVAAVHAAGKGALGTGP